MLLEFDLVAALPCVSSVSLASYLTILSIIVVPILKREGGGGRGGGDGR